MPVSDTYLTTEEIDYLTAVALSEARDGDEVTALDRIQSPTLQWLERSAKTLKAVKGGYYWMAKGNRNQEEEAWDGQTNLTFESHMTGFEMKAFVGQTHFGDVQDYAFVSRLGIDVKYGAGVDVDSRRPGAKQSAAVVLNYLREQADDIKDAVMRSRAIRYLWDNSDKPLYYTGILGLISPVTNTTGKIHNVSRQNELVRHELRTGVNADNIHRVMTDMAYEMNLYDSGIGAGVQRFCPVGDNVYGLLVDMYNPRATPANGEARGFDLQRSYESAMQAADKFKLGIAPKDAFIDPHGNLLVREPFFRLIDKRFQPAVRCADIGLCLSRNVGLRVDKVDEKVNHGMHYNRAVSRTSWFGSRCIVAKAPRACGAFVLAA